MTISEILQKIRELEDDLKTDKELLQIMINYNTPQKYIENLKKSIAIQEENIRYILDQEVDIIL